MFSNLTVYDILNYSAQLSLLSSMSNQEKQAEINKIIMELGLQGCRNTIIGSTDLKGIPCGERKRVFIDVEFVTS